MRFEAWSVLTFLAYEAFLQKYSSIDVVAEKWTAFAGEVFKRSVATTKELPFLEWIAQLSNRHSQYRSRYRDTKAMSLAIHYVTAQVVFLGQKKNPMVYIKRTGNPERDMEQFTAGVMQMSQWLGAVLRHFSSLV